MRFTSLLLLTAIAGCAVDDVDVDLGPDAGADRPAPIPRADLAISADNPFGNLSLVRPPDSYPGHPHPGDWRTIDGLSGTVTSRSADTIDVGVAGTFSSSTTVWLRVLVDGVLAAPTDIRFHTGGSGVYHSYHYWITGVAAGSHVVEVQWAGDATATIASASLTMDSASPSWGSGRLAVAAGTDYLVNTSTLWRSIPLMSQQITTAQSSDLAITFSAESAATSGQWLARALVDGVAYGNVSMQSAGGLSGALGVRSFTFTVPSVPAGTHSVAIQWRSTGSANLTRRNLAVFAAPYSGFGGGLADLAQNGAATAIGTGWTDAITTGFASWDPSSDAAITFSGELTTAGAGRMIARAVVDGAVLPGEVTVLPASSGYAGAEVVLAARNQRIGWHNVTIQLHTASGTV
jgi:hypothetical protein